MLTALRDKRRQDPSAGGLYLNNNNNPNKPNTKKQNREHQQINQQMTIPFNV